MTKSVFFVPQNQDSVARVRYIYSSTGYRYVLVHIVSYRVPENGTPRTYTLQVYQ